MNTLAALNTLISITTAMTNLALQAAQTSAIIKKAADEGRTELTAEEWAVVTGADDAARKALADAITTAKA